MQISCLVYVFHEWKTRSKCVPVVGLNDENNNLFYLLFQQSPLRWQYVTWKQSVTKHCFLELNCCLLANFLMAFIYGKYWCVSGKDSRLWYLITDRTSSLFNMLASQSKVRSLSYTTILFEVTRANIFSQSTRTLM